MGIDLRTLQSNLQGFLHLTKNFLSLDATRVWSRAELDAYADLTAVQPRKYAAGSAILPVDSAVGVSAAAAAAAGRTVAAEQLVSPAKVLSPFWLSGAVSLLAADFPAEPLTYSWFKTRNLASLSEVLSLVAAGSSLRLSVWHLGEKVTFNPGKNEQLEGGCKAAFLPITVPDSTQSAGIVVKGKREISKLKFFPLLARKTGALVGWQTAVSTSLQVDGIGDAEISTDLLWLLGRDFCLPPRAAGPVGQITGEFAGAPLTTVVQFASSSVLTESLLVPPASPTSSLGVPAAPLSEPAIKLAEILEKKLTNLSGELPSELPERDPSVYSRAWSSVDIAKYCELVRDPNPLHRLENASSAPSATAAHQLSAAVLVPGLLMAAFATSGLEMPATVESNQYFLPAASLSARFLTPVYSEQVVQVDKSSQLHAS